MPRYPIWKTILTKPVKGDSAEEKIEKKKANKETLEAVREVLDDEEAVKEIMEEFGDKKKETKEDYMLNRKQRVLRVL